MGDWLGSLTEDPRDESGLSCRRNRYHDPSTGQFTQQDPIGITAEGLRVSVERAQNELRQIG